MQKLYDIDSSICQFCKQEIDWLDFSRGVGSLSSKRDGQFMGFAHADCFKLSERI